MVDVEMVRRVVCEAAMTEFEPLDAFDIDMAESIADRVAKELAGAVVDPARSDSAIRCAVEDAARTFAPEAAEQIADRALRDLGITGAQREADLREAVLYGCTFIRSGIEAFTELDGETRYEAPSVRECEDAATEYARSKVAR